jgi:transcriptional regulator with XRE-family HTH domain
VADADDADDFYGAIVAKRRLARRLTELRLRAGLKLSDAGDSLNWSRGRLDRYERNEWRLPDASHVRDLARIYEASDKERAELEDLGRQARERVWWRGFEDVFGKRSEFVGFENDAARISVYMPLVLPGLLQTPAYARALLALSPRPPQWQERALAARLRRQQILDRTDGTAPRLVAVITEASLMYRWGSQDDRRGQAAHLAAMSRRPNVEMRLLRFSDGLHPGMISPVNIFDFPDDEDPSVVYLENDTDIHEVTKDAEVRAYQTTFARIRDAALAPAATRTHLDTLSQTQE